jgi:FAD binding domain
MDAKALSRRAVLSSALASAASALLPFRTSATARLVMNDASRLNPTPVMKHIVRDAEPEELLIGAVRAELKDAAATKRPVAVGAARHSMGGQSLPRDGTAITLNSRRVDPDRAAGSYRVDAGARWADVIKSLDRVGARGACRARPAGRANSASQKRHPPIGFRRADLKNFSTDNVFGDKRIIVHSAVKIR